ncbi:MAG: hypothetical protein LBC65_02100, partial [Oscillospiraceae bacterium]|nr:hypothetical protein [Oscillospiraceae bacterium]
TGSEKCSVWLAERLVKAYALPDLREDEDSAASRAALTARYEALRRIQTREFEETGAVITFTHRELL